MIKRRYYSPVLAIRECYTEESDNLAIESGFELLAIKDVTRTELIGEHPTIITRPLYVLGLVSKLEERSE
jgi:hypothetical protein